MKKVYTHKAITLNVIYIINIQFNSYTAITASEALILGMCFSTHESIIHNLLRVQLQEALQSNIFHEGLVGLSLGFHDDNSQERAEKEQQACR